MIFTFCNSDAFTLPGRKGLEAALAILAARRAQAGRHATGAYGTGPATALGTGPGVESRAYFRCDRLDATLSVQQCRANRERLTPHEALALPFDLPSWWVQPLPCWSCHLAHRVEAAQVPFFSADEVLAGRARSTAANSHHHC